MPLDRRNFFKVGVGMALCGLALDDASPMATALSQARVGDIVEVVSGMSSGGMAVIIAIDEENDRIFLSRNLQVTPGDEWIIYPEPV